MNLTCLQCQVAVCCRSPAAVYLGSKSHRSHRPWVIKPRSYLWVHLHNLLPPVYWAQTLHCRIAKETNTVRNKEISYRMWVCVDVLMQMWNAFAAWFDFFFSFFWFWHKKVQMLIQNILELVVKTPKTVSSKEYFTQIYYF